MKKIVSLIIVFACLFSVSGIGITAYAEEQKEISATLDLSAIDAKIDSMLEECDYVPGQIIFRTKKGLSRTAQTTILKSLDMVMSLEEISKKDYFENTLDRRIPMREPPITVKQFTIVPRNGISLIPHKICLRGHKSS